MSMTWKPSRPGRNCGFSRSSRPCGLTVAFESSLLMTSAWTSAPFCFEDHTTMYSGLASGLTVAFLSAALRAEGALIFRARLTYRFDAALAWVQAAVAASRRSMAPGIVLFLTSVVVDALFRVLASHSGLTGRSPSGSSGLGPELWAIAAEAKIPRARTARIANALRDGFRPLSPFRWIEMFTAPPV